MFAENPAECVSCCAIVSCENSSRSRQPDGKCDEENKTAGLDISRTRGTILLVGVFRRRVVCGTVGFQGRQYLLSR